MKKVVASGCVVFLLLLASTFSYASRYRKIVSINCYKTYRWVKVVIKLSSFVKPQLSYWTEENKVIVDFPNTVLGKRIRLPVRYGNVAAIRSGQFSSHPLVARVVVDLFSPGRYKLRYEPRQKKVIVYILSPSKNLYDQQTEAKLSRVTKVEKPVERKVSGKVVPAKRNIRATNKYSGISYWANKRITVEFRDANIQDVFRAIARMVGMNILIDSSVTGTITVSFKDVPFSKAFDWLLRMGHVSYRNLGGTIIVGKEEQLASVFDKKKTEIIPIRNAKPEGIAKLLRDEFPSCKVVVDERLRELIVTDTISRLEKIKKFIRSVDRENKQIMVDARVVEISIGSEKTLGINLAEAYKKWSISFQNGNTQIIFTNSGMEPKQFTAALNALFMEDKAHMLANPKIATLNGRKAIIDLTTTIPYVSSYNDGNPVFSTVSAGPKLEITPWIGQNGKITMDIDVNASTLLEWKKVGNTTVPVTGKRRAKTILRVKNNQPIIIGGLIREQDVVNLTKVPVLGDIPILGALFRNRSHTKQRTEVIIIITPHIMGE